jgi:Nif11 domain
MIRLLAPVPAPWDQSIFLVKRSAMSAFERFHELVVDDDELCRTLQAESDPQAFAVLAQRLGAERGFTFTVADVEAAIRDGRKRWIER